MTVRRQAKVDILHPASPELLDELLANLRPECVADLEASGWLVGPELREACARSSCLTAILLNKRVAMMAGTSDNGHVWVLATNEVRKHPSEFMAASRAALPMVLGDNAEVRNFVPDSFKASVRWLEWLGCEVGPVELRGPCNQPYRLVRYRRPARQEA